MAQNIAPAQTANSLKRKSPPASQERPSAAVKYTNATKKPGFSDGDGVEQDCQVEEDKKVSDDGQDEENGKSHDETETDSYNSNSDDEERHQPRVVAGPMSPPRRQAKFPGFNKAMELVLLKGLDAIKPFNAQYGETAEAWARVVRYLKDDDDKERARGKEARFELVNARNCKERWAALSMEYAAIAAKNLRDSGTNPTIDARYIELQEPYIYEQSCLDGKKAKKSRKHHAQAQAVLNKTNEDCLLAASRTGPVQGRTVEEQETALDQATDEDPPLQFSAGFLSGPESDTSQSTNTNSQHRPSRTPGKKKRALAVMVTDQLTLAAEIMRDQLEHNNQHLALLREERKERRKAEEARIQREEAWSRDQLASQERQHDTIAKLIEA
ncbi:hypothetical protein BGZ47_008732 [Haplosporangium gracile]|nr:hypothetical protein BGZ47_008732 [Haplosporangium gracile]